MRDQVIDTIIRDKVIVIMRGVPAEYVEGAVEAMYRGGISLVEITFDQTSEKERQNALCGIHLISEKFKGRVIPGAGTVLTKEQVHLAKEAGAKYIISPDANPEVIRESRACGLVSLPGCLTPTEIVSAINAGADFVKLFPAGIMGSDYVKAVLAPLKHVKMLAVGNINEENARDYIKAGCVGIGVGGSLVNKEWIANSEFEKITEAARRMKEAVII